MYKAVLITVVMMMGSLGFLHAQVGYTGTKGHDERLMQVSFGYPLSTNGLGAPQVVNNFSFNMLWGVNGGVMGAEFAGLLNYNTDDVLGAQVAGLCNVTDGNSSGIIVSGIANYAQKDMTGVHVSGVANANSGNAQGIQLAGISNATLGSAVGVQVAGVANAILDTTTGLYVSGVVNYSGGPTKGVHVSTINVTTSEFEGIQVGTVNATTESMTGAQIGVVNYSDTLKGLQLGVINVAADAGDALPIGVLSVVRGGYFAFELSASETHFGSLSYKMGVEKFYNIFSVNYQNNEFDNSLAYGYGIGTLLPIANKAKINLEAHSMHSFGNESIEGINQLNTARIRFNYSINDYLSVSAGPTYNVYVRDADLEPSIDLIKHPKPMISFLGQGVHMKQWFGFSAGVTLSI